VAATLYSMVMKRQVTGVHGVVATAVFLGVTTVVLGAVALVAREPMPWPPPAVATIALVYLAVVGTVAAFLLYFWLLAKTSLVVTSTLVFVYPLVALVVDALFERDLPLGPRTYLGVAVTLGGLGVGLLGRR
jgi:drug/metabolite transporter (DMT)-like permease